MTYRLEFRDEALQDYEDAIRWYDRQREGLDRDLVICVEAAIESILRNPHQYQRVVRDARRALVRRFPYKIVYLVRGELVVVIGVLHVKRAPMAWIRRL